jgi:hypothetical protein
VSSTHQGIFRRILEQLFPGRGARFTAPSAPARGWSEAAARAGLTDVHVDSALLGQDMALSARSGGLRVEVLGTDSSGSQRNSITVHGLGHRPGELELRPENLATTVGKVIGARELITGDAAFDDAVYVTGSPSLVHALLDAETRRVVVRFLQDRIDIPGSAIGRSLGGQPSVTNGKLCLDTPKPASLHPSYLADSLSGLLAVAKRLVRPADVAGRLALNLAREPLPDVRLRCLAVLVREYPGRPATLGALRAALDDPSLPVRLQAAKALGEEGLSTLRLIAEADHGPEDAQVEAIRFLDDRLSTEAALGLLRRALNRRRLRAAEACVTVLGREGVADVVEPLAKVMTTEGGAVAEAAARALGATGRPEAEAPLVVALAHANDAVKVAAAAALGQAGSASAVAPLRGLETATHHKACRWAARRAIAEIQSRLTGADPGQLSLAEGGSGQLSLAPDEAGRVTLPDDEE